MKTLLAIPLAILLIACGPDPTMPMYKQTGPANAELIKQSTRFEVVQVGIFRDPLAYSGRRGIYVITDNKTGKEFVGISGVGISESGSHMAGKVSVRDER